ncbi:PfkB family carbohydrate kinase [Pleomorphomonas koreensis]|uniref:PfkB family carbohydrate kinase n=1 Tax=Pleomorphomonas koreensis TaxID=257440 RepID=UPI0003F9C824|nr:PfkB family carbohydrate kinase [Pleomorphomonas koreensis]
MALHVVGNACVDTTFYLDRLPRPGETVNAVSTRRGVGGKGANQAVAAARTGAEVILRAALGADAEADVVRATLFGELPLDGLVTLDTSTDRSSILVDGDGENIIVTAAECASAFDPSADLAALAAGDHLLMQGNLRPDVTRACLDAARAKGAVTILNPSPLGAALPEADVVIVNAVEAEALTGLADPAEAARRLSRDGAASIVVTLGARGAWLHEPGGARLLPAPAVTAIDTSGAGDVLAGVIAGCLARGLPLAAAARVGVEAAAVAVTRRGTLAACPSRTEIAALIGRISRDPS